MMRVRIERVVDRHALARAQSSVGVHHGIAAAVGEDRHRTAVSRRRKGSAGLWSTRSSVAGASTSQNATRFETALQIQQFRLQQLIEDANAARLDNQIGVARTANGLERRVSGDSR